MKNKILILSMITGFFFISCQEEKEPALFKQQLSFDIDNGVMNTNTYIEGTDAHSGKKYSRADAGNNFGFGYSYILPDSLIGKNIAVDVNLWVRTGDLTNGCEFIVSASSKDSIVIWQGCGVKDIIKAPNEWSNLNATVSISSELTSKPNFKVTLLAHNADAKSFFDIDDLKVTFYEPSQP